MCRVVGAGRKARVTLMTTLHHCVERTSVSERTTSGSSPVSREQKSEAAVGTYSPKLGKTQPRSDRSGSFCRGGTWVGSESVDPAHLVSTVQAGGGGGCAAVWGMVSRHTLGPLTPINYSLDATSYPSVSVTTCFPLWPRSTILLWPLPARSMDVSRVSSSLIGLHDVRRVVPSVVALRGASGRSGGSLTQ